MRPRETGVAPVTLIGASVRAMAESARRAGWSVHAADLFCDEDLRRAVTEAVRADPYPDALPAIVSAFPHGPWLYTGALENHPEILAAIAAQRPLAGNGAEVVRAVRDVTGLAAVVADAGLRVPETRCDPRDVPGDGSFLVKPRSSAGGRGISPWHGFGAANAGAAGMIWQRRVAGVPWSAAFLACGGRCRLLGASRQITGAEWCHAAGFAYCGSVVAPLDHLTDQTRSAFDRLGTTLTDAFGLVGAFGVDLIIDERWQTHVLEVNPRVTASMELLERATGIPLAALHLRACGVGPPATAAAVPLPGIWAKAVIFAPGDLLPDGAGLERLTADWSAADGAAAIADVPSAGTPIAAGRPLLTLFAKGPTAEEALRTLRHRAAAIDAAVGAGGVSRRAGVADSPRPRHRGSTA